MLDNSLSDPFETIKKVVNTQYFAVLGSDEKGQPYTNLVAFAATDNLKYLVFITNRDTRKYRNIMQNRQVSLLIDSRTNQTDDVKKAIAITVIGSAREETDKGRGFHSVFIAKHPNLSQFVAGPDNALIAVDVSEYIIAGFEKTQRVVISP